MTTGILITARLKSQRLPRKALLPIAGRPMIGHLFDRLRRTRVASRIVLCTSTVGQDDALADYAAEEGIDVFRGDPDDVLARLAGAAETFGIDTVINCTGDNPFISAAYADALANFHNEGGYDYSESRGIPFGTICWALSRRAMRRALQIKDSTDTEFYKGYFLETGLFRTGALEVTDPAVHRPDLRLTVDTPEDFEVARTIIESLYGGDDLPSLAEIVAFCDARPELRALNADVVQRKPLPIRVRPREDWKEPAG